MVYREFGDDFQGKNRKLPSFNVHSVDLSRVFLSKDGEATYQDE